MRLFAILALATLACLAPLPAAGNLRVATKAPEAQYATVTGSVNLRTNPEGLGASDVILTLHDGERVQVYQRGETWCKVRTLKDPARLGWALCEYVERR